MAAIQVGIQANAWLRQYPIAEHLDEVCSEIAAAGYEGVEIGYHFLAGGRFNTKRPEGAPETGSRALPDAGQVQRFLKDHDLTLAALHTGGPFYTRDAWPDMLPKLEEVAAFTRAVGCPNVLISPAKRPEGPKSDADLAVQREHLSIAAELFTNAGASVYHHTHGPELADGYREMRDILEIDSSRINLAYDIANAAREVGAAEAANFIDQFHDRIRLMHYKDCRADGVLVEAVGEGVIDWERVAELLKKHRFSGWIIVEIEPHKEMVATRPPREDAAISRELIRRTMGV